MIEIPVGLSAELVPLSWLIGTWEGTGVLSYRRTEDPEDASQDGEPTEFKQRVTFRDNGDAALAYTATTWRLDDDKLEYLSTETGFWRLAVPRTERNVGPGLIVPVDPATPMTAEQVETYRTPAGGFPIQVALAYPDGVAELYLGEITGPRINLATDAVIAPATEQPYKASSRMYGLVNGKLMWAWDIAALGLSLRSHASAVLDRMDTETAEATSNGATPSAGAPSSTSESAVEPAVGAASADDESEDTEAAKPE